MYSIPICKCGTVMEKDYDTYPEEFDTFIEIYFKCPICEKTKAIREVLK